MSRLDVKDAAQNCASVMAAQRALKNVGKDQERIIREAHARYMAEKVKRGT